MQKYHIAAYSRKRKFRKSGDRNQVGDLGEYVYPKTYGELNTDEQKDFYKMVIKNEYKMEYLEALKKK